MSKTDEQQKFLKDLELLLLFALNHCSANNITLTAGELWRTPFQAWANSMPPHTIIIARTPDGNQHTYTDAVGGVGILKSKHLERLAIDLNFIKDGKLCDDIDLLRPIGVYWEGLSLENRAGMFFPRPDYPHFERNV